MTDSFHHLISQYGYLVVFLASLIEGESIILTASALASQGHLDIIKVGILAFLGTLFADQGMYYVGRFFGQKLFKKFPILERRSEKIMALLRKHSTWFILSFRFIYGIRILSPIVIGFSNVDPKKYMILNFVAAIIWTVVSCSAGYYLGDAIFSVLHNMNPFLKYAIIIMIFVLVLELLHRLSKLFTPEEKQ